MSQEFYYGIAVSIGIVIAGYFFAVWFRGSTNKLTEEKEQDVRLHKIEIQVALLNYQAKRRWLNGADSLLDDVHHPSPEYFEMDELLEKVENGITIKETERLRQLLNYRIINVDPKISKIEKTSARKLFNILNEVLVRSQKEV